MLQSLTGLKSGRNKIKKLSIELFIEDGDECLLFRNRKYKASF